MKISKKLDGFPKIKLSEVHNLQGNLKDLTEKDFNKLKKRLEKVGFKYPLYLWKNDGKFYNLDGNQRQRVIQHTWGDIELPYIEIEAKDEAEARKEILAISSQYGKVTKDGFDEFTAEFTDADFEEVEFETTFGDWIDPNISLDELSDEFELPDGDRAPFQQMTFTLADEQAELIKQKITDAKKTDDYKYVETFGNENSNGNALYLLIMR